MSPTGFATSGLAPAGKISRKYRSTIVSWLVDAVNVAVRAIAGSSTLISRAAEVVVAPLLSLATAVT